MAEKGEPTWKRFEVFTAVTMKNGVFWDIETQFIPHRDQPVNVMTDLRFSRQ
jgi:hypothetical protein